MRKRQLNTIEHDQEGMVPKRFDAPVPRGQTTIVGIPISFADRFAHDIPHARLVVLAQCGHMPQVECPRAFSEVVSTLLDSTP